MGDVASHATGNQTDGSGVGVVGDEIVESCCYDIGICAAYDTESHGDVVLLIGYKNTNLFAIFAA